MSINWYPDDNSKQYYLLLSYKFGLQREMEQLEITKTALSLDECSLHRSNYLTDGSVAPSVLCIPSSTLLSIIDYNRLLKVSASLPSKITLVRANSNTGQVAVGSDHSLTLFALDTHVFTIKQLTTIDLKTKVKDLVWHPLLSNILLVSIANKFVIYSVNNDELRQIFSHELNHLVECRWNNQGNILICTTNEELIAFEWPFDTNNKNSIHINDWNKFKKHELLTCRAMKNVSFFGNDNEFWTYSTPNLTIPNKETLAASKKQQNIQLDDLIRPSQDNKPTGILDSLTNISRKLLIEAEEIQTESEEMTKELPRIHLIRFDETNNRLYEVLSIDHANIASSTMLAYNERKRILLLGSKQKIDVFDFNIIENTLQLNYGTSWDLPSTLLGLKCEDDHVILLLGEEQSSKNSASFLSFDTSTKYANFELWHVKLPNKEMTPTPTVQTNANSTVNIDNSVILSAIQSLQLFVEDQFKRVNERLDRIEATINIDKRQ